MTAPAPRIAIAKGRLLKETLPLLKRAGIDPVEDPLRSLKLVLPDRQGKLELVIVRAADVPTYVEYGAADFGIVGKDLLMEYDGNGLYELVDLGISRCRMTVIGKADADPPPRRPRVATKYVKSARRHFARQGRQMDVVKLYGSMELAPVLGLSDLIVDLVDTGNTLRANGLVEVEEIARISARLIANKASTKIKRAEMKTTLEALAAACEDF